MRSNLKNKILSILFTLAMALTMTLLIAMPASAADTAGLVTTINSYGLGGGTGTALSATASGDTVTVTGGPVTGATYGLSLVIDPGVTVKWAASISGDITSWGNLIGVDGAGTFEVVSGGVIAVSGTQGKGVMGGARIIVSGGTVSATGSEAIAIHAWGDSVTVSDGLVSTYGYRSYAIYGSSNVTVSGGTVSTDDGNAVRTEGATSSTITVSNGTVQATGYGDAINTSGANSVIMVSGGTIQVANTGRAIYSSGTYGAVTVSGGTVQTTGSGGYAIFTSGASSTVTVSGGAVQAAGSDTAIYSGGVNSSVTVNGGVVSSVTGIAIRNGGSGGIVTVSDGEVTNAATSSSSPAVHMSSISPTAGNLVTVSGTGKVKATGDGGYAISTSGGVAVQGSAKVSATTGRAVNATGVTSAVTVSGGEVSSAEGVAITAGGTGGVVTVSGGLVFAYGDGITGISNVIYTPGNPSGFTGATGSGAVIAWDQAAGNTAYTEGESDDLTIDPSTTAATWHDNGTDNGIKYGTAGFFPILGVTVNAATTTAPAITSANSTSVINGAGGTFQVTATGTTPITYALTGTLPTGVSINSTSGLITIAGTVAADTYTFTVTASNGTLPNATQSFTLTVTDPIDNIHRGGGGGGSRSYSSPPPQTPSEKAIDGIGKAKDGDTVRTTLTGSDTTLKKEVFETLAGKDITLEIIAGNVTWIIYGKDVSKTGLKDLDFGVSVGTSTVPADVINLLTGKISIIQISLKHDGPFGFTMTLQASLGSANAGYWANLYYYNMTARKMEFKNAAKIGTDGVAPLSFSGASDYAIVIDTVSHETAEYVNPFSDAHENDWFYGAVKYVYEKSLMVGTGTDPMLFSPGIATTRSMIVTILYRVEGEPDVSGLVNPFSDVAAGKYYTDAVIWAAANSIVSGYGNGKYGPEDNITREQLATILNNYAVKQGLKLTALRDYPGFDDDSAIASYAKDAVEIFYKAEIINGKPNNLFDPKGNATRAEMASMLMGFLETDE